MIPCYEPSARLYEVRAFSETIIVRRPRPGVLLNPDDYRFLDKDSDGNQILFRDETDLGVVYGDPVDTTAFSIHKKRVQ